MMSKSEFNLQMLEFRSESFLAMNVNLMDLRSQTLEPWHETKMRTNQLTLPAIDFESEPAEPTLFGRTNWAP